MKKRDLFEAVAVFVSICLTTGCYFEGREILGICWFFIGVLNAANLVRRVKASKKVEYDLIPDDSYTDDI